VAVWVGGWVVVSWLEGKLEVWHVYQMVASPSLCVSHILETLWHHHYWVGILCWYRSGEAQLKKVMEAQSWTVQARLHLGSATVS
jgi:hypothetical protein